MKLSKSFLSFLVISVLIWLVLNMSRTYIKTMPVEVVYTNLPQDKVYRKKPKSILNLEVKGTGFSLFSAKFSPKKIKISLDKLSFKEDELYYFLSSTLSKDIQSQLANNIFVNGIGCDSLYFSLGSLAVKKVPIVTDLSLEYKLGYDVTKISLVPDSISLSGTKSYLNTIFSVKLAPKKISGISEDLVVKVPILIPKQTKSSYKNSEVHIKVDKFTEGEFELPINVKNLEGDKITIYPNKVKVFFRVGLKYFSEITPDLFRVEADYQFSKKNKLSFLSLKLEEKPNMIFKVRLVPEKINFLINK